jgi:predicted nuclease of predicted toxin-antitoxin system
VVATKADPHIATHAKLDLMKFLIDECLHTSLLDLAHAAGHAADHVSFVGLAGSKDRDLMSFILKHDYTFVTNNRSDFLALYNRVQLHAGLILIVPNVVPEQQRRLFKVAVDSLGEHDLINRVLELGGGSVFGVEYWFPRKYP